MHGIKNVYFYDWIEQALDRCVGVTLKKCLLILMISIILYKFFGLLMINKNVFGVQWYRVRIIYFK